MITKLEMEQLIHKDANRSAEDADWIESFYELWMERYHALDIIKFPSDVIKLPKETLLKIMKDYNFDELHLFKIHQGANVFALLSSENDNYWSYKFLIIKKEDPTQIAETCNTVEDIKDYFNHKEPILEVPLPNDRKYIED